MPFSPVFVEDVLDSVYFYFANRRLGQQCIGRINNNLPDVTQIWIATGRTTAECFARTVLHEIGHALGLGEATADLFMEMFMGFDETRRTTHNLTYNSTFDRLLHDAVGATKFWEAAFHSNSAYGNLWNQTFGNIITHAELELVRGLSLAGRNDINTRNEFFRATGEALTDASDRMFDYKLTLLTSLNGQICTYTYISFRNKVDTYLFIANRQHVSASNSVLDLMIEIHNIRMAS